MMKTGSRIARRFAGAAGAIALFASLTGCTIALIENQIEEHAGDVSVIIINNTPYRATFTLGAWEELEREEPGDITVQQFRLDGNRTTDAVTIECRRNLAIGTQRMVDRVIATDADAADGFDRDALRVDVSFSSAPEGSNAEALPTAGTAEGLEVRLGNQYSCEDQLIFTFEEDASVPGGFRIDYEVVFNTDLFE